MSEARKKVLIPAKRRETAEEAFIHHGLVRKGVKQTVSRTIRVTPGEFKSVQHRAIEEGVHYSDVIRAAICKYLNIPFDKSAGG